MNTIRKLPGRACLYYIRGRCLYEERLNPGLNKDMRCRAIQDWERHFEGFLDRAEAFCLSEVQAGEIWPRQFRRRIEAGVECPEFVQAACPPDVLPGCVHQMDELCLLAMPACEGVCRRYKNKRDI